MSDAGDAIDSASGILGTVVGAGIGLMGIKMMTDMISNMNKTGQGMNKTSELKAQNTLNFNSEPKPRKEQKSYNPPNMTELPRHNYFTAPPNGDFFSPDIKGHDKKKQPSKPFWDW